MLSSVSQLTIIFRKETQLKQFFYIRSVIRLWTNACHINAHTFLRAFWSGGDLTVWASPHRGAGHEIKLLLVISVQLLPPWPLVVCVPERDIRPLSKRALPQCVCVRERTRCFVSGPLHQDFIFFWIEFYYRASSCQSQLLDWHTHTLHFQQWLPLNTLKALPPSHQHEQTGSDSTMPLECPWAHVCTHSENGGWRGGWSQKWGCNSGI